VKAAQRITLGHGLVQEWIEHFTTKAQDYNSEPIPGFPEGFENADVLGVQGQFAEIWRKIWKLYKGMWKGEQLKGEPTREVLLDMISHCFLAIDMLDRQGESDLTPVMIAKPDFVELNVLNIEISTAGDEAVKGRPETLEAMGLFLNILLPVNADSCISCGLTEHAFSGKCRYRIARRRS
jgi:hypothetical protein